MGDNRISMDCWFPGLPGPLEAAIHNSHTDRCTNYPDGSTRGFDGYCRWNWNTDPRLVYGYVEITCDKGACEIDVYLSCPKADGGLQHNWKQFTCLPNSDGTAPRVEGGRDGFRCSYRSGFIRAGVCDPYGSGVVKEYTFWE